MSMADNRRARWFRNRYFNGRNSRWLVKTRYSGMKPEHGEYVNITSQDERETIVSLGRQLDHGVDHEGFRYVLNEYRDCQVVDANTTCEEQVVPYVNEWKCPDM